MSKVERALVLLLCGLVGWFYVWTARSTNEPWKFGREQRDYYNFLIDGWLDGQLHMKVEVPEALLKLPDPYDPRTRSEGVGLHDASFYRGKYYVYFGAAPVVTLMLPFRVITGTDLPLAAAVLVLVYGGFLASVALFLAVRRRYFLETPTALVLAGVLVLGFAALGPLLLRRPHMWELPIAAGYCFVMLALGGVWRSVMAESAGRRARWLAAAALALGFAVASRPTYLFACALLAVPIVTWWRRERRWPWREWGSAFVPLAVVGGAMAWHNYARFGDPLQFGQAYQLSLDYESKQPHFQAAYVPYNVAQHFFGAAQWQRYFPFVQPPAIGAAPAGYTMHRGDVYGLLANLPIAWLAWLAPLALWRRTSEERAGLGAWLGAVVIAFAAPAAVMVSFFSALARYQLEFAPALMLLAVVGMLSVGRWLSVGGGGLVTSTATGLKRVGVGLIAGAAVWSAWFGVLYSLQFDGLLQEQNPALRTRIARALNRMPAAVESVLGVKHGAVEIEVRWAGERKSGDDVLLVCGEGAAADRVFFRMESDGRRRVGFQHNGALERMSEPMELASGRVHRVKVTMGALYPPAAHPFFQDRPIEEVLARQRQVRIEIDERAVLDGHFRFASGGALRAGRAVGFSGEVVSLRRTEGTVGRIEPIVAGDTVRLRVRFPAGRVEEREPLVVTGRTGAGDLLRVEYLAADTLRFALDHWGGPGVVSEAVKVNLASEHALEITLGSLATVRDASIEPVARPGRLRVALDGRVVLEQSHEFFTAEPGEVAVGWNPIGGTTCGPRFTGEVLGVERVER